MCEDSGLVYESLDTSAVAIRSGVPVDGIVGCSEYVYYTIDGKSIIEVSL